MPTPPGQPVSSPPPQFAQILPRVCEDLARQLGGDVRLGPFTYEDRRFSHLLHAQVSCDARAGVPPVFVKIYKAAANPADVAKMRTRVEHDYRSNERAFLHMSRWPGLTTVQPVGFYPEQLAVASEEARGETLLARLERSAAGFPSRATMTELSSALARTGAWLKAYSTLERIETPAPAGAFREYEDIRLKKLVAAPLARFTAHDREQVLAHIERLSAAAGPARLEQTPAHGDLALGNLLVDGDRIVVLDFGMAGRGMPFQDLARVYVLVDLLRTKPQYRASTIRPLLRALVDGFDPGLRSDDPRFRLVLLRHHVNHLVTLSERHERFPAGIYNWFVRREHRRWIAHEVASSSRAVAAV